jgi:hypothetical protein
MPIMVFLVAESFFCTIMNSVAASCCFRCKCCRNIGAKMTAVANRFWLNVLKLVLESYLELTFASLLHLKAINSNSENFKAFFFTNKSDIFATVMCLITLAALILLPLFILYITRIKDHEKR